jgi:hypothetical protein
MHPYWSMWTTSVAQILAPELEQNFYHKRAFIVSHVHLESQKNILIDAQSLFLVNLLSIPLRVLVQFLLFPLQIQSQIFLTGKYSDDKEKTFFAVAAMLLKIALTF